MAPFSFGIFRMPHDLWLHFGLFTWPSLTCHHDFQGPPADLPPAYVIIVHIIDLNYHDSISAYLFIPLLLIYHTNCLSIPQNTWEERKGLLFLSRFSGTLDLLDTGRRSCVPSSVHIGCLCQDLLALLASCFPFCEGDVGTSSHKEVWAPQEVTIITLPGGNTHTAAHIKLGFILRPEK